MRKIVLIIFMLLLFLNLVNAQLEVSVKPVNDIILPNEKAVFDLTITNKDGFKHTLSIVYLDVTWLFESNPSKIVLNPDDSKTVTVSFTPKRGIEPYIYVIPVSIYSEDNPNIREDSNVKIKVVGFDRALDIKFKVPSTIDPLKETLAVLEMYNMHNLTLKNINLDIKSDFLNVNKKLNFEPYGKKSEEFKLNIGPKTERGIYNLDLKLSLEGNYLYNNIEELNIGFAGNVREIKDVDESFLLRKTTVIFTNEGDEDTREVHSIALGNWISKTFTDYNVKPYAIKKDNNYLAEFRFDLKRGRIYKIEAVTNYRTPIILLIIIAALLYLGISVSSDRIVMAKRVIVIKNKQGIADMKIQIIIKNKGSAVKEVKVIDQLPKSIRVPTEYSIVKPNHVKRDALGITTMVWDIRGLLQGEERILGYRIKHDNPLKGIFTIPRSVVKYKTGLGKVVTIHSNKTIVSG